MKKVLTLFLSLFLVVGSLGAVASFAAGEAVSVVPGSGSVTVGGTVDVTYNFSSDDTGCVFEGSISYDASCLQPVSASNGDVNLSNNKVVFSNNTGSVTVTYQVIGAGNASVSLSGVAASVTSGSANLSGSNVISCVAPETTTVPQPTTTTPAATTTAPAETTTAPQPTTTAPQPTTTAPAATTTAPAATTTAPQPTTTAPAATTTAPQPTTTAPAATTTAPAATTTAPAATTTAETDASADIVSQSEELRLAALEEDAEASTEELSAEVEETDDSLVLAPNLDGIALPDSSCEQITYTYHGNVYTVARTVEGIVLLPVVGEDGGIIWYVYNESTDEAIRYCRFSNVDDSYIIICPDDDVDVPEEFEEVKISMNNNGVMVELPAWRNPLLGEDSMFFVYAINSKGQKGIYRFDGAEGVMIRFVEDIVTTAPTTTEPPTDDPVLLESIAKYQSQYASASAQINQINSEHEKNMLYRALIIIGLGALSLLLLLIIAVMGSSLRKRKKMIREAEAKAERYQQSANAARAREFADRERDSYQGVRPVAREEGTSGVRPARPRDDREAFSQRGAVSEARPASRTRQGEQRRPAGRPEGEEVRRSSAEAPARKRPASANPERRRPAEEGTERRRPAGEGTPKRRPVAENAEGTVTGDTVVRRKPVSAETAAKKRPAADGTQRTAAPKKKRVERRPQEDMWEESEENLTVDLTGENNMTESVKVAAKQKSTKLSEDLFGETEEANADFDITDFKNI